VASRELEVNGFLPVDRVIVRRFSKDKCVVLEGNRLIYAAKLIGLLTADRKDVGTDVVESVKWVPCLLYTEVGFPSTSR
jgi:hypothetical protein